MPTKDAPDILNCLLTISVMFIADIGVHKICLVNKEPATKAAIITRPHPVKKNCHRRFNRLCFVKIIKFLLSLCTCAVYTVLNQNAIFIFISRFFCDIIVGKRDE